jgi:hypothetical protein
MAKRPRTQLNDKRQWAPAQVSYLYLRRSGIDGLGLRYKGAELCDCSLIDGCLHGTLAGDRVVLEPRDWIEVSFGGGPKTS